MIDWTDISRASAIVASTPEGGWHFWHWTHDHRYWWEHELPVWVAMTETAKRFYDAFQPHIIQAAVALIVGALSVGGTSIIVLAKQTEKTEYLSRRLDDLDAGQKEVRHAIEHHEEVSHEIAKWIAEHDAMDRQREKDMNIRMDKRR